jgi:16S rRNA (uracil1498-N3)-methyltransferase
MSERFFASPIGDSESVDLTGEEAHHLARVRRIRHGEKVCLFDGSGTECMATVRVIQRDRVTLTIDSRSVVSRELPFQLTLACSPAKGERFRWLVEKATELGVTDFVPLLTHRSSEQARSARADKMDRWVIEGSKQCGRNVLMRVRDPVGWEEFINAHSEVGLRFVADPSGAALGSIHPHAIAQDTVLAVGPEGGFTAEELAAAQARGWKTIRLGKRTLRVETAAIALVARVVGDR